MIIGSHVSMSAPDYLVGAVKETLSYGANAMMIYTGAPQNTVRKNIEALQAEQAFALLNEHGLSIDHVVVHAPYIINLANTVKSETFELAVSFLAKEIARCNALGLTKLVLHPGSHVNAGEEVGLAQIIKGLDAAMQDIGNVTILLETMAGKGSELGKRFEQLKYIRDHVAKPEHIGICLDTCHVHDAGYNLNELDALLDHFDEVLGLDLLQVIHLNDSNHVQGAAKDRHANLGDGEIGFDSLYKVAHHPKLKHVIKILETPYIDGVAPYKAEIDQLL
ncbi:MAG: deoxyribonuclease IV, partial [Erysipelotrichaceae bacterium]